MMSSLPGFIAVIALLTVTPGMDTALILRTAVAGSRRRAWGVVLGIQGGTLIWGVLTAAGLTAIFTASRIAYETLRWAGAAYLIWLGVSMLWKAGAPATVAPAGGFRRGLLTNLLNPKMGAFYVALLPQFIPAGAPVLGFGVLLALIHIALGTAWSALLVALAHRLRTVFERPVARRVLDRVTGTVLTAFGIRLVTSGP